MVSYLGLTCASTRTGENARPPVKLALGVLHARSTYEYDKILAKMAIENIVRYT